jgi:hypothetical protein
MLDGTRNGRETPARMTRRPQTPNSGLLLIAALALLPACRPLHSSVIGETPRMVSVCSSPHDPWQQTLDLAEASCQKHHAHAVQIDNGTDYCRRRVPLVTFECKSD